jgi:hypothetical protein
LTAIILFSFFEKYEICIVGVIKKIDNGKDGYTAIVKTEEGKKYRAVISRVNMSRESSVESEYRRLNIGDRVQLCGDSIHFGDVISITVKKMTLK